MSLIRPLLLAALLSAAPLAMAHANGAASVKSCRVLATELPARQADITKMTSVRDTAAQTVETAGEAWEEAETHRLISAGHASAADTAKAAYETARSALTDQELALQDAASDFNDDVAAFNKRCAKK